VAGPIRVNSNCESALQNSDHNDRFMFSRVFSWVHVIHGMHMKTYLFMDWSCMGHILEGLGGMFPKGNFEIRDLNSLVKNYNINLRVTALLG